MAGSEGSNVFQVAELVITDGTDVLLHQLNDGRWDIFSSEVPSSLTYRQSLASNFPFFETEEMVFAGQVHKADLYRDTGKIMEARRAFFVVRVGDLEVVKQAIPKARQVSLEQLSGMQQQNALRRPFLAEAVKRSILHDGREDPFCIKAADGSVVGAKELIEEHPWIYEDVA